MSAMQWVGVGIAAVVLLYVIRGLLFVNDARHGNPRHPTSFFGALLWCIAVPVYTVVFLLAMLFGRRR